DAAEIHRGLRERPALPAAAGELQPEQGPQTLLALAAVGVVLPAVADMERTHGDVEGRDEPDLLAAPVCRAVVEDPRRLGREKRVGERMRSQRLQGAIRLRRRDDKAA